MPHEHRHVASSAATVGSLTAISRVLGFVRDLVIATAFGTGVRAEAFVVSFKIPNLLRDLVGEGASNAAFVPVLTETYERKRHEFWGLVATLFWTMGIILVVISVLGIIFTPAIVKLIAPGFTESGDPEKFLLTVTLTRVMFPYVALIGLSALAMGVLNSMKEFGSSAMGPILLNLCMIVAGIYFEPQFGPMALVVAVLCGGVLQLACQVPHLVRRGFTLKTPRMAPEAAKKIGKLLIPRAFGSALYQINVFVDSILASFEKIVGAGGQSALYYSNRLFQLPLAIFGISLAQAVLPTFASQAARNDRAALKEALALYSSMLLFVVTPASVGLAVLAEPIVRIVFQHGEFDAYSTSITSSALFYYAWGLVACSLMKLFVNAFYSLQDTRTPLKFTGLAVGVNIGLSLLLMPHLKVGGLALASTVSAFFQVTLLWWALKTKIGDFGGMHIVKSFAHTLGLSLAMGAAAWAYKTNYLAGLTNEGRLVQSLALVAGIVGCILFYGLLARVSRSPELGRLLSWRRK